MDEKQITEWCGLPLKDYDPSEAPTDYASALFRISDEEGEANEMMHRLEKFVSNPESAKTRALVIAEDMEGSLVAMTEKLIEQREHLPHLQALFLGPGSAEYFQISWMQQSDLTKVLHAFPGLEELRVRGSVGLKFQRATRHLCLKKLVLETGGVPKAVLNGIHQSVLPELEHLEIWIGSGEYGWDGALDDIRPFFESNPFPKLKYLALCNSEQQDEIALMAADAPVLEQLDELSLAGGSLRDRGGEALLAGTGIHQLKKLDLHHNFMSQSLITRFKSLPIEVDVSGNEQPDEGYDGEPYYYISVSE